MEASALNIAGETRIDASFVSFFLPRGLVSATANVISQYSGVAFGLRGLQIKLCYRKTGFFIIVILNHIPRQHKHILPASPLYSVIFTNSFPP
jgi:hypothetical protein